MLEQGAQAQETWSASSAADSGYQGGQEPLLLGHPGLKVQREQGLQP